MVLYVDDLLIMKSTKFYIDVVKSSLHDTLSMTDLGLLHFFLGLEINQFDSGIKIVLMLETTPRVDFAKVLRNCVKF